MACDNFNKGDEDMVQYKKCGLNVVSFHIVYNETDLQEDNKPNSFKPDMAHQIFGESEMIFGYKNLKIDLYYLHNSAKCFVDIQTGEKLVETEGCKADDVMGLLKPWLPMDYTECKLEFQKQITQEKHDVMFGDIIENFSNTGKCYKVTICDGENEEFAAFHHRFETLIIWFIDGANFIDLADERWTVFYVYEEQKCPETGNIYRSPIGFCTVYKFFVYPDSIRPRISQFFILPTHQKRGIGTKLYSTVYNYMKNLPKCSDITVEEPTEVFQKIRDYCDSLQVFNYLRENGISFSSQNSKKINEVLEKLKLCKRQKRRVFDILQCSIAHKNGYEEFQKFTNRIKERITNEIERESRGSKRLCNLERTGIVLDHIDIKAAGETEYNKYINSLEWPTNRLRVHL